MSCFFPPIFKKNTYKKVKFSIIGIVLASVLLFSGCKMARAVVAAPFKAVGWGATKVSEAVGGVEEENSKPKIYELNPNGTLTEKKSKSTTGQSKSEINFKPLVMWGIILVSIALIVRFLMNRYVYKNFKE